MLIHQSQAGCVIGKAGNKLKEMRQDFGVDMKVYSQCCPRSSERIILVIGKPRDVCKAIANVIDILKTVSKLFVVCVGLGVFVAYLLKSLYVDGSSLMVTVLRN